MNEKKEVESSKKIVTNTDSGEKGAVLGSVNVKTAKKISKKQLIISSIILLVILIIVGLLVALNDKNSQNQEAQEGLNNIMATKPADYEKQYEWSRKTSAQLEKDTSYKNGDIETKTDYYNKLIGLYIAQKSEQKARDLYMNEIHPGKITLNANYLNWLYENYISIQNKQAAIVVLDDLIVAFNNSLDKAEDETEKSNTRKGIEDIKKKKEELSK
jgi:hypothetical protein